MKIGHLVWASALVALGIGWAGCSDGGSDGGSGRSTLLDRSALEIASDGLGQKPSAAFTAARSRIDGTVPKDRRDYATRYNMAGARGADLVRDETMTLTRRGAAQAMQIVLDEAKEADAASAQLSLDLLLPAIRNVVPGASSCLELGDKAADCVIVLLLLELKRSEKSPTPGDAAVADAGTDAGDAGTGGPISWLTCGNRDVTGAREINASTTISASETWSGKILLHGNVLVRGGTLTIAPGTEIFMDVDSSLEIGWNNSEATLVADGTTAPIRICGKNAERGYWGALTIGSNVTSNSLLKNVLIADGGGDEAALQLDADVAIDNVQVRNAGKDGVWARDFKSDSRALSVAESGGAPIVLLAEAALARLPLGGGFLMNTDPSIRLRFYSLSGTTVVRNLGLPYVQEMSVQQRGSITFEPGVEWRVAADAELSLGWNNATSTVHVNGAAGMPVVFRSAVDASTWAGLSVESNVTTDSNLSYMEVRQAGSQTAALEVNAAIRLEHVKLVGNAKGMLIGNAGLASGSTDLSITQTAGRPLSVQANSLPSLPQGGSFTGNTTDEIEVLGYYINKAGTIPDLGIPYFVAGDLQLQTGANVTIAAGTDFIMGADSKLTVGWNNGTAALIANGTAEAPIRFLGADTGRPGSWEGIEFDSNALSTSVLNHVEIGNGGTATGAGVVIRREIPVTNCRIHDSAGYGLSRARAITRDYAATNTFTNNALGDLGTF